MANHRGVGLTPLEWLARAPSTAGPAGGSAPLRTARRRYTPPAPTVRRRRWGLTRPAGPARALGATRPEAGPAGAAWPGPASIRAQSLRSARRAAGDGGGGGGGGRRWRPSSARPRA
jgi:hypothetical protein